MEDEIELNEVSENNEIPGEPEPEKEDFVIEETPDNNEAMMEEETDVDDDNGASSVTSSKAVCQILCLL